MGIRRGCTLGIAALAAAGVVLFPVPGASADAPQSHRWPVADIELNPGESGTLPQAVPTTKVPPKPDLYFLSDTTSSMGAPIDDVRTDSARIVSDVLGAEPSSRFGVAEYRDVSADQVAFRVDQSPTAQRGAITAGIGRWVAAGGGDVPEDSLNALDRLATGAATFREGGTRMVLWLGDAPSHDPSDGHSLGQTVAALRAADIRVVAVDVGKLNALGQAGAVAAGTGGVLLHGIQPDEITRAVLAGISPIRVTVTARVLNCDPGVSMRISPAARTVVSGSPAGFTEHVSANPHAEAGDYACQIRYTVDGKPGPILCVIIRVWCIADDQKHHVPPVHRKHG